MSGIFRSTSPAPGALSTAQNHAAMKVGAFREFASQLAVQVVEQLCGEFEREVNILYSDVWTYRVELERVAELLGHQLHRERQLHDMLATVGDVHSSVVAQMENLAQVQPDSKSIHDMIESLQGHQVNIINNGLSGVSEAVTVASGHAAQAKQLKEQSITAEHEFNRILQLLSQPLVPGAMPTPTAAPLQQVPNRPAQQGTILAPSYTRPAGAGAQTTPVRAGGAVGAGTINFPGSFPFPTTPPSGQRLMMSTPPQYALQPTVMNAQVRT